MYISKIYTRLKNKVLHRLRSSNKIIKDFYVFDTETRIYNKDGSKFKYTLRGRPENFAFGCIYGYNFSKVIYSLDEFKNEFKKERYKNKYVFAHNAEYDLNVIYGNIYSLDRNAIFNGKFICATNTYCKFGDSFNIYHYGVEKIGQFLGKPKTMTYNTWKKEISKKDIQGCIRDCEIIYDALLEIFNEVGSIKITQAALSMTFFRRHFLKYNIEHNEFTKDYHNSYYGGRNEAFKIGNTHALVYDINSSYPFAMVNCKFPNPKYNRKLLNVTPKDFINYLNKFEGCAKIKVNHYEEWLGFLPFKKEGKLLFPVGVFEGWFNFNEIRFALEHNVIDILEVKEMVYSPPMVTPFKEYIDTLFLRRIKSDSALEVEFLKIFMNSLYGKFAQRIDEQWIYLDSMIKDYHIIKEHQDAKTFIKILPFNEEREDCFLVVKASKTMNITYSIPSFASYITSFGRIHLLKQMIALKDYKPVYCDTDSIFVEIEPPINDEHHLGGWKRENKIVTKIKGLKNYLYITDDELKRRLKGVPKKGKQKFVSKLLKEIKGKKQFIPVPSTSEVYEYETLVKTREALRRGLEPGINMKRTKVISNKYEKRVVLENGETKPIKL